MINCSFRTLLFVISVFSCEHFHWLGQYSSYELCVVFTFIVVFSVFHCYSNEIININTVLFINIMVKMWRNKNELSTRWIISTISKCMSFYWSRTQLQIRMGTKTWPKTVDLNTCTWLVCCWNTVQRGDIHLVAAE